jgi:peptidoglycan/LPS O-acetylase OafA/YrhL
MRGKVNTLASFRGDIQGLRAIAVLVVLAYHSGVPGFSGGYVGVDVFFVVSGFLITNHLLKELTSTGTIRFRDFYARRARRLLPASFAVICLTLLAAALVQPPIKLAKTLLESAATASYVPNLLFALQGTDYLAETTPSSFQHYWSLGIEEQFYLIWPIMLVVAFRFVKSGSTRLIGTTLLTVTVVSLWLSIYYTPINQPFAFFLLPTRAWEFGAGALLAFGAVSSWFNWLKRPAAGVLGWLGLAAIFYSVFAFSSETLFPGSAAIVPVTGAALVMLSGTITSDTSPMRILSTRPAIFIGGISYSLYLIHWPLLVIPQDAVGSNHPLPVWGKLALGAASIPLAWLLYRYVEQPFRHRSRFTQTSAKKSLAVAVSLSAVISVVSLLGIRIVENNPLNSGIAVAGKPLGRLPVGERIVPSNLEPRLWEAKDSLPEIYANGCHLNPKQTEPIDCETGKNTSAARVVLFGDSHAAQWYPALESLAQKGLIRLKTLTKSACPSASISSYRQCETWRRNALREITLNPPDIVLLANFAYKYRVGGRMAAENETHWRNGLAETLKLIPKRSKVFILSDTPNVIGTPAICLSANLNSAHRCNVSRDDVLYEEGRRAERGLGVPVIDVTDWFCDDRECPSIIGNILVYRDANHMTVTFSAAMASVLAEHILPELPS